jgi:hypothetical protein
MSTEFKIRGAIAACLLLAALGCQNSTTPPSTAATVPAKAIVVTGGNGGSTTVFIPSSDPNNPVVLCSNGTEVCPECKAAAVKYFQTGVLDPKCNRTGATRAATTIVAEDHSHN